MDMILGPVAMWGLRLRQSSEEAYYQFYHEEYFVVKISLIIPSLRFQNGGDDSLGTTRIS